MPTVFETEIKNQKRFTGNVVIRFIGQYFCIYQPDSGLVIPVGNLKTVQHLTLNPTQVDLKRVSQTVSSYSFKIIDRAGVITALVKDRADALVNQEVEIWIGRITGSFDFSDYYKLPITKIKKITHEENSFSFSASETTDRMTPAIFDLNNKLAGDILSGTTVFTLQEDIATWPTSGLGKIDKEFFSWSGKDNTAKQLTGILRGLKNTTALGYSLGQTVQFVYDIQDNPLNILLKILISGGGGGTYDVYPDGLGIPNTLIDITAIENLRDTIFTGEQFKFSLYSIKSALKFLENEILLGCNLRFVVSANSKISLTLLDQSIFGAALNDITEDTIASYPKWEVDDNKIVNVIQIEWDFDEGSQQYKKISTVQNAQSIIDFGERNPYTIKLKGIQSSLSGQTIIDDRTTRFLERFGTPNPEISFKTHIDKQLLAVGEKVLLTSTQVPSANGTLNFATELEVISRAINYETGDVNFKLAFTSYSGIRACYISPSDTVQSITDQKTIDVAAGRGDCYTVGWKMRLWDNVTKSYTADAVNTIESISGDTIVFTNNWATSLIVGQHRLKFPDYDDATADQKRYCYISDDSLNFNDGASPYQITF